MVNKKLMTSLFDIKFEWGTAYSGWTFYKSNEQTVINPPATLHLYLNDKIPNPATQTDYNVIYAKPAGESTIRRYKFTWKDKRTGEPWDYATGVVYGDITLVLDTKEEQYWTIYFATPQQRIYSSQDTSSKKKILISGRTYETVPDTIYNVRHNQTTFSDAVMNQVNSYATLGDSSTNKFYCSTNNVSDNLEHACLANGWACAPYTNIGSESSFIWGSSAVKNNLWVFPNWKYKTNKLKLNYNTGTNYYYSDFESDFTFNGASYAKTKNIQYEYDVDDNFTPNNCSQASDIKTAAWNLYGTFNASGWNSVTTKVVGWYTDAYRTTGFSFDDQMTEDKLVYAKWGVKNGGTARSLSGVWGSSSGTWYAPSFCNNITVFLRGGGGNSSYESNAQVDKSYERMECEICTPGGWGKTKSKDYDNISKKKIVVNAGGPAAQSSATINSDTITAAAGATGSGNGKSFNLNDIDKGMEREIAGGMRPMEYIKRYGSTYLNIGYSAWNVGGINGYYGFMMYGWRKSYTGNSQRGSETWVFGYEVVGEGFDNSYYLGDTNSGDVIQETYRWWETRGGDQDSDTWSGIGDSTRWVYPRIYRWYNDGGHPVPGSPGMGFCITRSSHTKSVQGSGFGGEVIISYRAG